MGQIRTGNTRQKYFTAEYSPNQEHLDEWWEHEQLINSFRISKIIFSAEIQLMKFRLNNNFPIPV